MLEVVKLEDAVGRVLAHDITEIRPGHFKGAAFKRGHTIRETDICRLQRLGKGHVYVLHIEAGYMHEDEAAVALANGFCGSGATWDEGPHEGKIKLVAAIDGLLQVEVEALTEVNMLGEVMCSSRHTNSLVKRGETVAATRAIPLVIQRQLVEQAVAISRAAGGLFRVRQLHRARAGIVITGNEVFTRLIEDRFEPILKRKLAALGSETVGVSFAPDTSQAIAGEISHLIAEGADLILTTGGMSVDPDDATRQGIIRAGAADFIYGSAVIPGAMFMIAYIGSVPVLGVPACGLYHETTLLDLILPRVLVGERLTRRDIAVLGHGGLCLHCPECRYPTCPFGKCG